LSHGAALVRHVADIRRRDFEMSGDLFAGPPIACLRAIGLQQDACSGKLRRRVLTFMDQGVELVSLVIAELRHVLLYAALLRGHDLYQPVMTLTHMGQDKEGVLF